MPPDLRQFINVLTSSRSLWIVLWSGLALLTVALLIVTRTKWGQARPMSKCVVLSVFAHLLLIGYAYKTELFAVYPTKAASDSIRVTLISSDLSRKRDKQPAEKSKPWEHFISSEVTDPEHSTLARDQLAADLKDIQYESRSPAMVTSGPPTDSSTGDFPIVNEPEAPQSNSGPTARTTVDAAPINVPRRKKSIAMIPESPTVQNLNRVEIAQEIPDSRRQAPVPKIPHRADEASSRLNHLAEAPHTADPSDLVNGDMPFPPTAPLQSQSDKWLEADQNAPPSINHLMDTAQMRSPVPATPLASSGQVNERVGNAVREGAAKQSTATPIRSDGSPLPDIYESRLEPNREDVVYRGGGSVLTEAAVEAGLKWIAANQSDDGRWDASQFGAGRETRVLGQHRSGSGARADTGITGLALLALLGAGHTHVEGTYRKNVQLGLEFLLRSSRNGNMAGDARTFSMMYCHGIALFAISEAFAMTGDDRLQPFVQSGVDYTVSAQHPHGGWRYRPGERGDMSQFGWQIMALRSAELASIEILPAARARLQDFLRRCSSGKHGGLASYRPGEGVTRTMTAEALLCRLFMGMDSSDPTVQEAAAYIDEQLPGNGRANLYYWYYATLAMHQIGGEMWEGWNVALKRELLDRQRRYGNLAGSWDPDTIWAPYGGRIYSTAMAILCLEVYYRYVPPSTDVHETEQEDGARIGFPIRFDTPR